MRKGTIMLAHHHHSRIAGFAAGLAASILPAAPAAAAQERPVIVYADPDIRTERVRFADLDLASAADQKRLHFRVGGAVERLCGLDLGRDGLQDRGFYACSTSAWGDAAPQIALAVERAQQIALTGSSAIAASAIVVRAR
jgi:UrcA family protein